MPSSIVKASSLSENPSSVCVVSVPEDSVYDMSDLNVVIKPGYLLESIPINSGGAWSYFTPAPGKGITTPK